IQVKEVKFRPGTDEGDYKIKLRNLTRFLEEGDKTKVTLRFRGREMAHQEFGIRLLERVKADLEPVGIVEQFPRMEGRQLVMVLGPKKTGVPVKKKAAAKPAGEKPAGEKPVREKAVEKAVEKAADAAVAPAAEKSATSQ
ncbi:MAG TPA: translation initiation factor IF-3, partial [Burkholderiales bacterium]|nr:translation initiation factor IF-3 [Burkholderiales bacterium]